MKIVVSVKCVPDSESVDVRSDRSLDMSGADWQISPYDLNAIEAACQLKEKCGDISMVAITAGGSVVENSRRRKDILSRGAEKLFCVRQDELQTASADALYTAGALTAGIKQIGDVDLAVFGEGSGDMYAQQTGLMVGALLGWPAINGVTGIELDGDALLLQRTVEDGTEQLRVGLPAVVCVTSDMNVPRFASVKDTLSAGKKPFEIWELSNLSGDVRHGSTVTEILAPEETGRRREVYKSADEEAVSAIVGILKKCK